MCIDMQAHTISTDGFVWANFSFTAAHKTHAHKYRTHWMIAVNHCKHLVAFGKGAFVMLRSQNIHRHSTGTPVCCWHPNKIPLSCMRNRSTRSILPIGRLEYNVSLCTCVLTCACFGQARVSRTCTIMLCCFFRGTRQINSIVVRPVFGRVSKMHTRSKYVQLNLLFKYCRTGWQSLRYEGSVILRRFQ